MRLLSNLISFIFAALTYASRRKARKLQERRDALKEYDDILRG